MAMSSKIKIAYIITSSGVGGAEKILYHTVTGLDYNQYSVSIFTLKEKGVTAKELEKLGIEVHCLHMANKEGFMGWLISTITLLKLFSYLRRLKPTIIHSFLFRANILARLAGYLTGVPIIISSIRVMGGGKRYFHYLERMTSFMVDHYITVSKNVKKYIVDKSKISVNKISVIYNGVKVRDRNSLKLQNVKLPFDIKPEDKILITVGRLHKQKGHYYLIHAILKVGKEVSNIKLLIIGEGEEENNLKNLTESLDLTDKVIFMGVRFDVESIISTAKLFVLPSLWEGMPNVLLEAMAAEKPVVATEVGGVAELVINGETGLLVPSRDSGALASAIIDLLQNDLKAKRMGRNGRIRVEKKFNISKTLKETENLYQKLLKEKRIV